jgi:hypothetical protein
MPNTARGGARNTELPRRSGPRSRRRAARSTRRGPGSGKADREVDDRRRDPPTADGRDQLVERSVTHERDAEVRPQHGGHPPVPAPVDARDRSRVRGIRRLLLLVQLVGSGGAAREIRVVEDDLLDRVRRPRIPRQVVVSELDRDDDPRSDIGASPAAAAV